MKRFAQYAPGTQRSIMARALKDPAMWGGPPARVGDMGIVPGRGSTYGEGFWRVTKAPARQKYTRQPIERHNPDGTQGSMSTAKTRGPRPLSSSFNAAKNDAIARSEVMPSNYLETAAYAQDRIGQPGTRTIGGKNSLRPVENNVKTYDSNTTFTMTVNNSITVKKVLSQGIAQGTEFSQRVGVGIKITHAKLDITLNSDPTTMLSMVNAGGLFIRVSFVWDYNPILGETAPDFGYLWGQALVDAPIEPTAARNVDHKDRFHVFFDKVYFLNPKVGAGAANKPIVSHSVVIDVDLPNDMVTQWRRTDTLGDNDAMVQGKPIIYLSCFNPPGTMNAGDVGGKMQVGCKLNYIDTKLEGHDPSESALG